METLENKNGNGTKYIHDRIEKNNISEDAEHIRKGDTNEINPLQFLQIKHEDGPDDDIVKKSKLEQNLQETENAVKKKRVRGKTKLDLTCQNKPCIWTVPRRSDKTIIIQDCTTEEQRAVVRFLWAKGQPPKEIYKEMFPVYNTKCLSRQAIHNWVQKFSQGRVSLTDVPRPGRPVEIATAPTIKRVEEMIRENSKITIDYVATALGCSHGLACTIIRERLNFRRVRGMWVPKDFSEQEK